MTVSSRTYQKRRERRQLRRRRSHKQRRKERRLRAQAHLRVLEDSFLSLLGDSGLEEGIRRKLGRQGKLLAELFAMMFPTAFGGGSYSRLTERLGMNKNLPGKVLAAHTRKTWQKKLRKLGQSILKDVLSGIENKSPAVQSRNQVTLVVDSSVFRKFSESMALVGRAYSGQTDSVVLGVDVVLLIAVIGEGKLIVPLDFAVKRPNPKGRGRRSRGKLDWTELMVEEAAEFLVENKLVGQAPLVVGDSWFGSSALAAALEEVCGSTILINGKSRWVFYLQGGLRLTGKELHDQLRHKRKQSPMAPGQSYARALADSPSFGRVLLTVVWPHDGQKPYYLLCRDWKMDCPRILRAWHRRAWVEWCFRALKHLLDAGVAAVHTEAAFFGHLTLRLMGLSVLCWTVRRRLGKGATIEDILWSIEEHWQTLDSKLLCLNVLSPTQNREWA